MASRLRCSLLLILTIMVFIFSSVISSHSESAQYVYDELNRLIQVRYSGGTVIEYSYDQAGNRIAESIEDVTPPTTIVSPRGGTYNTAQSVTLTCNDGQGSGCDKIYYTTDGSTPTTSSPVYSSPITISATTTLKFFAMDLAGNGEAVKSQAYTILSGVITVTVQLKDSAGNALNGGVVQYYSGGWQAFGTTDASGRVSKELRPASYTFSMTHGYARQEKSQNIAADPTVVFTTGQVHSDSGSCTQYYAGGWRAFTQDKELLPVAYTFRFSDGTANSSYSIIAGTVNHIH